MRSRRSVLLSPPRIILPPLVSLLQTRAWPNSFANNTCQSGSKQMTLTPSKNRSYKKHRGREEALGLYHMLLLVDLGAGLKPRGCAITFSIAGVPGELPF